MNCKNCQNSLKETQRYCDICGAIVIRNRLTPKVLINQLNEQFLSIDNKFLQTLIALIVRPEDVIGGYIDGVRKKYINVIGYYAISLTVLGFQMFLLKNFFPEFLESQNNTFSKNFNVGDNKNDINQFFNFAEVFNDYQGVIFSMFLPFLAIGTWILY